MQQYNWSQLTLCCSFRFHCNEVKSQLCIVWITVFISRQIRIVYMFDVKLRARCVYKIEVCVAAWTEKLYCTALLTL